MPEQATTEVIRTNLLEHRAVKAWRELRPARTEPTWIETLKKHKGKSRVYRLGGVGPGGTAVVAKRCRRATALIERTVYEEVLPRVPMPMLRYYGFVEEPDGECCWLFVEDAGGGEYSPLVEEHRALAGRWLGAVHTAPVSPDLEARLPARGPAQYLEHLRSVREAIVRNPANPALSADDLVVLKDLVAQCDILESGWSRVERSCAGMPRTLVHGDFVAHNARVRPGEGGADFLPFDWGIAGWGVAAVDLAQFTGHSISPDISSYWPEVRHSWPHLDARAVQRLANAGAVFRSLAGLHWHTWAVTYQYQYEHEYAWLRDFMGMVAHYRARLVNAMRAAEWG